MDRLLNFLLYQVGWFACVLGAAWHFPWLGMSLALVLVAAHLGLAMDWQAELKLALVAAAVGLAVDSLQLWMGVFTFSQGVVVAWLPPPWMTVLWIQFATTFRYSMAWLSGRYKLSACCGFLGAPLAFFAGENLKAVTFLSPRPAHYFLLALLWSLAIPLLIRLADRLAPAAAKRSGYRSFGKSSHAI